MPSRHGITSVKGTGNDIHMFDEDCFDVVLSNATLEHDKFFWLTLAEMERAAARWPAGDRSFGVPAEPSRPAQRGARPPTTSTSRWITTGSARRPSARCSLKACRTSRSSRSSSLGGSSGTALRKSRRADLSRVRSPDSAGTRPLGRGLAAQDPRPYRDAKLKPARAAPGARAGVASCACLEVIMTAARPEVAPDG